MNKITGQHINHMKRLLKASKTQLKKCYTGDIKNIDGNLDIKRIVQKIEEFLG